MRPRLMYDDLVDGGFYTHAQTNPIAWAFIDSIANEVFEEILRSAVVFRFDSQDLLFDSFKYPGSPRNFPNAKPPYNTIWCEYKASRIVGEIVRPDADYHPLWNGTRQFACLIQSYENRNECILFTKDRKGLINPMFCDYRYEIDGDGEIVNDNFAMGRHCTIRDIDWDDELRSNVGNAEVIWTSVCIAPALFGLSLMNCANVSTVERHPGKTETKKAKRNGVPVGVVYRELLIPAPRRDQGNGGPGHTKQRLHLVRGHFKRRKTGTFWWSAFARGDANVGVVDKTYTTVKQ